MDIDIMTLLLCTVHLYIAKGTHQYVTYAWSESDKSISFKHGNFKGENKKVEFKSENNDQHTQENVSVKYQLDWSNFLSPFLPSSNKISGPGTQWNISYFDSSSGIKYPDLEPNGTSPKSMVPRG